MRLRAPVPDDAPAVLAVLAARDRADFGVVDYTLEDLLDEWRTPGFELGADAVVAEDGDGAAGIVAYACVRRPGVLAAVAPSRERGGIGAELLRWAEQRESALGRPRHRQWVAEGNAAGQALLRAAGYDPVRSYWRMAARLDSPPEPAPLPGGVTARALEPERDAAAVYALDQASFAANPDYQPESFDEFRREHLEAHDLDPDLSLVAARGDDLAGILLARRWKRELTGFVDILAVHPTEQGRGLGSALLGHAFAGFAAAGLSEAQLGVASDNPRALGLYERAGMRSKFRVDVLERAAGAA